jgi:hypothetical protein
MRIKSKFSGRCTQCGGVISIGQECEWERGAGVRHIGSCPEKAPPPLVSTGANGQERVTVSMGVFRKDGRIFVVKPNKDKTRVYAKEIVESPPRITENGEEVDFEAIYRPGVIYTLNESDRWDIADAQDFLTKYARCIVCNRHLKAAKSVAEAIGPVCRKYFAHNKNYTACAYQHNHNKLHDYWVDDSGRAHSEPEPNVS